MCGIISLQGCAALSKALQRNITLVSLDIQYNCAESDALSTKEQLSRNSEQYCDELAVEAKEREVERNESLLKLHEQERIEKEKDAVQWLADEKVKREESRRVETERLQTEDRTNQHDGRRDKGCKEEEARKVKKQIRRRNRLGLELE